MDRQMPRHELEKLMFRLQDRLPMWVVYRPVAREYPGSWVTRMFLCLPSDSPTSFVLTGDTLGELRSALPRGLTRFARDPNDIPEIEEIWF